MTHRYRRCRNPECEAIFQLATAADELCPDCAKAAAIKAEASEFNACDHRGEDGADGHVRCMDCGAVVVNGEWSKP